MTNSPEPAMPGYDTMFDHTYAWVNKGEWRSHSHEESALIAARGAAVDQGVGLHDVARIVLDRLPCNAPEMHRGDLCVHLQVSFLAPVPETTGT